MGNRLEGKVAIVTGGGRGIGRGECLALASEGARIIVNDFGGSAAGTGGEQGPADEVVAARLPKRQTATVVSNVVAAELADVAREVADIKRETEIRC